MNRIYRAWDSEELAELRRLVEAGRSSSEIAVLFGRSASSIEGQKRWRGIKSPPREIKIPPVKTRPAHPISDIQKETARSFRVPVEMYLRKRGPKDVCESKQLAMYIARRHAGVRYSEIARRFGGRDHSTVIHAVRATEEKLKHNQYLARKYRTIVGALGIDFSTPLADQESLGA